MSDFDTEYCDAVGSGFFEYDYPLTFPHVVYYAHWAASIYDYNTQTFTTYRIEQ